MKQTTLIIILISLFIACNQNDQKNYSGDLEIGIAVEDSLNLKEPKPYSMELDSNSFIFGIVDQISVDVVVSLYDPDDELIESFDGPAKGSEFFSFEIKETGSYRLEVAPFKEKTGVYSIKLEKIEPIASDPGKRVDQIMYFYSGDVPGAVVGVIRNGKLDFTRQYGKANLTHQLDFDIDMPTNIGSVSKQFTAYAILLLEKEGKLSLDDDVRKHIPEIPDFGDTIRIKNLLNHTNGLREVYNLMPITGWKGEDALLREEILSILKKQPELQAIPGEEYNYNNSAFIMLAEIVERISGMEFPDWMEENVFGPLGMDDSYVRKDPTQLIPNATQGYSNGENGYIESGDLYASYGAGGIYTTAGDLAKWLNNFSNTTVGSAAEIDKLVTPGILNDGDTMDYALGIGVRKYKGLKIYAHSGADIAHRASLIYFPEIDAGVVTLSNNSSFPSNSIAYQLANIFFSEHLEEEEKEEKIAPDEISISDAILEEYTGKYKAQSIGLVIEYKLEDGQLVAYPTGQSSLSLKPTTDSTFDYQGVEASILFKMEDDGTCNSAVHTQGGNDLTLVKLDPFDPSISELQLYTGRYFSEELETYYNVLVKDSVLIATHRNLKDIKLDVTEEDVFSSDVFFISELVFTRNSTGQVEGFTVSNGRTKGIVFKRQ